MELLLFGIYDCELIVRKAMQTLVVRCYSTFYSQVTLNVRVCSHRETIVDLVE